MGNKLNLIGKILFITILVGYIIYIAIKDYNNRKARNVDSRYTIGNVIEIRPLSKSGYNLKFVYKLKNQLYKADQIIDNKKKYYMQIRFYVKFEKGNPDNCEILLDKPVPDSIKDAPPEGWDKIP